MARTVTSVRRAIRTMGVKRDFEGALSFALSFETDRIRLSTAEARESSAAACA
jgi:hypothetical protein